MRRTVLHYISVVIKATFHVSVALLIIFALRLPQVQRPHLGTPQTPTPCCTRYSGRENSNKHPLGGNRFKMLQADSHPSCDGGLRTRTEQHINRQKEPLGTIEVCYRVCVRWRDKRGSLCTVRVKCVCDRMRVCVCVCVCMCVFVRVFRFRCAVTAHSRLPLQILPERWSLEIIKATVHNGEIKQ